MGDKLYELMDWARIEGVVYSEENAPREILGPQVTRHGILIQCFFPEADKIDIVVLPEEKRYPMTMEDEAGFFAALIPGKKIPSYQFSITDKNGKIQDSCYDAYAFENQITKEEEAAFAAGLYYDIYEKLGAHPMTIDGVEGVYFAVWAPNAIRVSVAGDFNDWDGRVCQMNRLFTGIYELFIPGVKTGAKYKYELKMRSGATFLKADPYAGQIEQSGKNESIVSNLETYKWRDSSWMKKRKAAKPEQNPMFVYEINPQQIEQDLEEKLTYKKLAEVVIAQIKKIGYTHVELMPIMEYCDDNTLGYQTLGYYAPTGRYGTFEEFKTFVDMLHRENIGLILDWVPSQFYGGADGLEKYDGTALYEYQEVQKSTHPLWGGMVFNYASPYVKNFLIANALFWCEKYHIDGIRINDLASMLYLDYSRSDGNWIPNIYGGNENLEAIEFIKHLNSILKKKYPDVCMIAEEATGWPMVTGSLEENGLGFDFKWNNGWNTDFLDYLRYDPVFRGMHHEELTFSMIYAYSEKFLLSLSHDQLLNKNVENAMPGTKEQKLANLRAAFGYMVAHPGKKLLYMGQETTIEEYMTDLLALYRKQPALYEKDYDPDGFEWINALESEKNIVSFIRKGKKKTDTLLIVCNFSALAYENYQVGVPFAGKYKEIFNSDAVCYGGSNVVNPRIKMSKKVECDERKNSIVMKVPPLGISVFVFSKAIEKVVDNKKAIDNKKVLKEHEQKTDSRLKGKSSSIKEQLEEKMKIKE